VIVRILNEGQFEVDGAGLVELEKLDGELVHAIDTNDEEAFERSLRLLHAAVRASGKRVAADRIVPSDLTLPPEGATIGEVVELLGSDETREGRSDG
jgi:hypothetical protein